MTTGEIMKYRIFATTGAAIVLSVGLVTLVGVESAWAVPPTGTGSINCTTVKGKVTFHPALTLSGTPSVTVEKSTVKVTATGCTTAGSNIPTVAKGVIKATIITSGANANACTNLLTSKAVLFTASWHSSSGAVVANTSRISMPGYTIAAGPPPTGTNEGFVFPNAGGIPSVIGSFPGSDNGNSSSASAYTNRTQAQILTQCATSLPKLTITSGGFQLS